MVGINVTQGSRLQKPGGCPDIIYDVMRQCWMQKASDRPFFYELCAEKDGILTAAVADVNASERVRLGKQPLINDSDPLERINQLRELGLLTEDEKNLLAEKHGVKESAAKKGGLFSSENGIAGDMQSHPNRSDDIESAGRDLAENTKRQEL